VAARVSELHSASISAAGILYKAGSDQPDLNTVSYPRGPLYFNVYDTKHHYLCMAVCQNFPDFNQIVHQLDLSINFFLCNCDNFSYKLLS